VSAEVGQIVLGRYRLTSLLGEGGMGRVFLGEHAKLGTKVAVKVLLDLDHPSLLDRFLAEAKTMARLNHPHVVAIIDYGHVANGAPILVMEYIAGESLADQLDRDGPIPWRDASRFVSDALDGLEAAHAEGIVHRDIKPPNILIARGRPPVVKLADFGIAKPMVGGKLTATGLIVGTPDYMAPEVLAGQHATPSSDVYAMATTLFELITGTVPFENEAPLARFEREARPLVSPASRPEVPGELADVVARGLARHAEKRWATADEFKAELDAVLRAARTGSLRSLLGVQPTIRETPDRPAKPKPIFPIGPTTLPSKASDAGHVELRRSIPVESAPSVDLAKERPTREVQSPRRRVAQSRTAPSVRVDSGLRGETEDNGNTPFLLVAAIPPSRLALPAERRFLASALGDRGRGYSIGAVWFAIVHADLEFAETIRETIRSRYGSTTKIEVSVAPVNFQVSAGQLAGAKPLPPPLPALLTKVMT
jgi:serine/threonine protein kinase